MSSQKIIKIHREHENGKIFEKKSSKTWMRKYPTCSSFSQPLHSIRNKTWVEWFRFSQTVEKQQWSPTWDTRTRWPGTIQNRGVIIVYSLIARPSNSHIPSLPSLLFGSFLFPHLYIFFFSSLSSFLSHLPCSDNMIT